MLALCSVVNQKNQQVENIIGEKTVVALYEQPAQTVLPNQLIGIVVELFYSNFLIGKQRILFYALSKSVVLINKILPTEIFILTEIKISLFGCLCNPFSFVVRRTAFPTVW